MKQKLIFKLLCMATIWFYSTSAAMAGQVITQKERDWAQKVLKEEADLGLMDSTNSIAVLNYRNLTTLKLFNGLQKGMALMLITDLSKVDNLFVVERNKLQALLDEMDLGMSATVDPKMAPVIGKLLKVSYVSSGDIEEGGLDQLKISPTLLDVPFGQLIKLQVAAGDLDNIVQLEKGILFNILDRLGIYLPEEKTKELMIPLSDSTAALQTLFLAVDYSDKGMYEKAAELYKEALIEDPGLELAQEALIELQDLGLIPREDIPATQNQEEAKESSLNKRTIIGVGLGIAAIAGVAVIAGGSSSSSSGDSNTDTNTDQDGLTPSEPIASISKTSLDCSGDNVVFTFSETMNTAASSSVTISPTFENTQGWEDDTHYVVTWNLDSYCSTAPEEISMTLNSFKSIEGASLAGSKVFTFQFVP